VLRSDGEPRAAKVHHDINAGKRGPANSVAGPIEVDQDFVFRARTATAGHDGQPSPSRAKRRRDMAGPRNRSPPVTRTTGSASGHGRFLGFMKRFSQEFSNQNRVAAHSCGEMEPFGNACRGASAFAISSRRDTTRMVSASFADVTGRDNPSHAVFNYRYSRLQRRVRKPE